MEIKKALVMLSNEFSLGTEIKHGGKNFRIEEVTTSERGISVTARRHYLGGAVKDYHHDGNGKNVLLNCTDEVTFDTGELMSMHNTSREIQRDG